MAQKVNIVGAGVAGLSAGCYLQMNGYNTEIFELHNVPGGLCTGWRRKEFVIDNCIHWLVGSSPGDRFYNLWNELIDMESIEFVDHDEYGRVEDRDGNFIAVYTNVDRLEKEMLDKAPENRDLIREFTGAIRKFLKFDLPVEKAQELYGLLDVLKLLPKYLPYRGALKKWGGISAQEYADRCRNPLLKKTFEYMFIPEMAVLFLIMTLVWMHKKSAGYPIGGSLNFARLLEKKYLELGGRINYKSKVTRITTKDNLATGIELENGDVHSSDIVISAADGHYTIFEMLEGKYVDEKIRNYYDNYVTFPSYLLVSLGVARTFENEPNSIVFPLEKPLVIDESIAYEDMPVRIFNFDPTLAPAGKTVVSSILTTVNHEYWDDLRKNDREEYKSQKQRIADEVIEALEGRFGNIKQNVEVIDVSTPSTVIRYTNNWKGSFEGWILTPKIGLQSMKKVLPGLGNFYMSGQWVEPGGGVPTALMSGRNVAQIICKKDRRKFTT